MVYSFHLRLPLCAMLNSKNSGYSVHHFTTFVLPSVHIHRNAVYSLRRGRENVPAAFLFYECQKIILIFDFELQLIFPFSKHFGMPHLCRGICDGAGKFNSYSKSQNPRPVSPIRETRTGHPAVALLRFRLEVLRTDSLQKFRFDPKCV